jgi:hypothetical protein
MRQDDEGRPALAVMYEGRTYTVPADTVPAVLERLPALQPLYEHWRSIGGGIGSMIVADPQLAAHIVRFLDEI